MSDGDCDELELALLRQSHEKALDRIRQYETEVGALRAQLAARDERVAALEEKIVHMSLQLASSRAFEDAHRSVQRMPTSDFGDRDEGDVDDGALSLSRPDFGAKFRAGDPPTRDDATEAMSAPSSADDPCAGSSIGSVNRPSEKNVGPKEKRDVSLNIDGTEKNRNSRDSLRPQRRRASLENTIVNMSLELASLRASEDALRSTQRIPKSDCGDGDNDDGDKEAFSQSLQNVGTQRRRPAKRAMSAVLDRQKSIVDSLPWALRSVSTMNWSLDDGIEEADSVPSSADDLRSSGRSGSNFGIFFRKNRPGKNFPPSQGERTTLGGEERGGASWNGDGKDQNLDRDLRDSCRLRRRSTSERSLNSLISLEGVVFPSSSFDECTSKGCLDSRKKPENRLSLRPQLSRLNSMASLDGVVFPSSFDDILSKGFLDSREGLENKHS